MAGFIKLLKQKWYPPAPDTTSFAGRTVLVTGATTGLGLEAAKKIACLEPQALIITARSKERGEKAKEMIQRHVRESTTPTSKEPPPIHLLLLNMSQFETVIEFAKQVTTEFPSLNTVILNAGTACMGWKESPDGWEEQIQVNCLSTTLLALLLLPQLVKTVSDPSPSASSSSPPKPHLEIVTSGLARMQPPDSMARFLKSDDPLTELNTKPPNPDSDTVRGSQKQYALSKVIMETNMKHIANLPLIITPEPEPEPDTTTIKPTVIITSSCPGLCSTDLAREMGTGSLAIKLLLSIFYTAFGRSAEQGSNTLVSALTRDVDGHGKMWKDDMYHDGGEFLESPGGREFGDKVWDRTCEVLLRHDPSLEAVLGRSSSS